MYKLDDKHLEKAKEITLSARKRKSCKNCYDRGYIGINEQNMVVLCHKCVDADKATADWKEYVLANEDLKEHYGEFFDEEEE
jgi:hypothetical protein